MAKINRTYQKIFAKNSSKIGQFGSKLVGTKVITTDLSTIQALSNYEGGWETAVDSGQKLPTLEELNGLFYQITTQLSYLFQEGIPEYDSSTTYYSKSIVRQGATSILYQSKVDNNTGNLLTDNSKWLLLGDLANLINAGTPTGTVIQGYYTIVPSGYLHLNGQSVSKTTYANLYNHLSVNGLYGNGKRFYDDANVSGNMILANDDLMMYKNSNDSRLVGSYEADGNKAHTHVVKGQYNGSDGLANQLGLYTNNSEGNPTGNVNTLSSGNSEVTVKNVALMACIKF